MIEIHAGKTALNTIQENGFTSDIFTSFMGASGGPKWFCLYSFDKYLFGEFFKHRTTELNIIGSSAGAFRAACFAQKDPVSAIKRLAKHYSETVYSSHATADEVTRKARDLLMFLLGTQGAKEILENPVFKAHFFVARAKGLVASENKLIQGSGLVSSYLRNQISRRLIRSQYERFVYQPQNSSLDFNDRFEFNTQRITFTMQNLPEALLASGSIPMVMQGIKNIPGSPKGMYRDGGIIDYHFDLNIKNKGLTLYPHFNSKPKAGWFDKKLNRSVHADSYDKTVLICPSAEFIASLPYAKIPDRTDFTKLDAESRIKYWKCVLAQTSVLGDALAKVIDEQNVGCIKALTV